MIAFALIAATLSAQPAAPRTRPVPETLASSCTLPPVAPDTHLVVLSAYEGSAVSSVAVNGQDRETTAANIEVAPGRRRLTLVLVASNAIVYRFGGATRRIRRLILVSSEGAGAVGIARAHISFADSAACRLRYASGSNSRRRLAARIGALFGRDADVLEGIYELHRARIDSTGIVLTPAQRQRRADHYDDELWHFYPGGIARLNPRAVVASGRAERYGVLPNTAGIVQLLREGALARATPEEIERWREALARSGLYSERTLSELRQYMRYQPLRVVRPIDVPAELCGAHSVTFLAPDARSLRGNVCHSNVLFLDGSAIGVRPGT